MLQSVKWGWVLLKTFLTCIPCAPLHWLRFTLLRTVFQTICISNTKGQCNKMKIKRDIMLLMLYHPHILNSWCWLQCFFLSYGQIVWIFPLCTSWREQQPTPLTILHYLLCCLWVTYAVASEKPLFTSDVLQLKSNHPIKKVRRGQLSQGDYSRYPQWISGITKWKQL